MRYSMSVVETVEHRMLYIVEAKSSKEAREKAESGETIAGGEVEIEVLGVVGRRVETEPEADAEQEVLP